MENPRTKFFKSLEEQRSLEEQAGTTPLQEVASGLKEEIRGLEPIRVKDVYNELHKIVGKKIVKIEEQSSRSYRPVSDKLAESSFGRTIKITADDGTVVEI
jgi:hypothetical protein